ncbi:RICIN domain-containing protein, partial [Streptomyces sp. NPDC051639]|uniref:RICIN domain-containing protein n=1 Tax=Streptomyces sp. NPDC051639 TaxID=3155671 RepID=UPI00343346D8
ARRVRSQPLHGIHETPGHNHNLRSLSNPGRFTSSFDSKGYYWIKAGNGMCLTVPYNNGTPPSAGTQLFWWGCETRWFSGSQMWNIIPTKVGTKGAYMFINNWTGLCLSMDPATASASGGKVTQDTCPK